MGSGSRPYVPTVQGGAANTQTLAAEMPNLDVLRQHTFGSPSPPLRALTTDPEKVLALAKPLSRALGARLNNSNRPLGHHTLGIEGKDVLSTRVDGMFVGNRVGVGLTRKNN